MTRDPLESELASGTRLGPYEVRGLLGQGGMGRVYRARDVRLERDVALKVLDARLEHNAPFLRRFRHEARAAGSLSHPAVVHVYDVGPEDERPWIAMELVEGRTLRDVLAASGPFEVDRALDVAAQVAEAIAQAHDAGVVHRDLKPENLMLDADGRVRILDFGLAKAVERVGVEPGEAATRIDTLPGAILGTSGYMSPEQAAGDAVDARSDQFNLGLVLRELLTGERAFRQRTVPETLTAILREELPPVAEHRGDVPPPLEWVLDRCLAKDPADRWESTRHLAEDLRRLGEGDVSAGDLRVGGPVRSPVEVPAPDGRRWGVAAGLLAAALVVLAAVVLVDVAPVTGPGGPETREPRSSAGKRPPSRRSTHVVEAPPGLALGDPALAPDGSTIVYPQGRFGSDHLWSVALGEVARQPVRLTEGRAVRYAPAFSPDGMKIAFTREPPEGGTTAVAVLPAAGGDERIVLQGATMPAYAPDGARIAAVIADADGGQALASFDEDGEDLRIHLPSDGATPFLYDPSWSPDGRRIALRRSSGGQQGDLWLVEVETGHAEKVTDDPAGVWSHHPEFTPDGRALVHVSNRGGAPNLWSLDLETGVSVPLTSGAGPDRSPSVAADGSIAMLNSRWRYVVRVLPTGSERGGAGGEETALVTHPTLLWAPALSPDGTTVAYSRSEPDGSWSVWLVDAEGGEPRPVARDPRGVLLPRWFPDGRKLLVTTWSRPWSLLRIDLETGTSEQLVAGTEDSQAAWGDLAPDGERITFARLEDGFERPAVRRLADGEETSLYEGPGTVPRFSPDGRRVVFARDRSDAGGLFVADLVDGSVRRVTGTGGWPVWWPDGERVGFLAPRPDGTQDIRVVELATGAQVVLDGIPFHGSNHLFDVSPDGSFVVSGDSRPSDHGIWLLGPP